MRGKLTLAQVGSSMASQRSNASSRQASIHSGSSFLAEMKRTMSAFRPLGANSWSMLVTKPCWYFSSASTCSTVCLTAGISVSFRPPARDVARHGGHGP